MTAGDTRKFFFISFDCHQSSGFRAGRRDDTRHGQKHLTRFAVGCQGDETVVDGIFECLLDEQLATHIAVASIVWLERSSFCKKYPCLRQPPNFEVTIVLVADDCHQAYCDFLDTRLVLFGLGTLGPLERLRITDGLKSSRFHTRPLELCRYEYALSDCWQRHGMDRNLAWFYIRRFLSVCQYCSLLFNEPTTLMGP
jgi:hypothetical protein